MRQKEKKERQRAKTLCLEISDKGIKVADENRAQGIQPRNYGKQSGGTLPYPN